MTDTTADAAEIQQEPLVVRVLNTIEAAYGFVYSQDAANAAKNLSSQVKLSPLTKQLAAIHAELTEAATSEVGE